MVLNVVFFSWSAYLIYRTNPAIEYNSTARTEFLLYLRLALIMGLTWITAIIALVENLKGIGCFTLRRCLPEMCSDDDNPNIPERVMFLNYSNHGAHLTDI
jgi:hypothetical protein